MKQIKVPSLDIPQVLRDLAKQRPLFHAEADFQHALAWELHRQMPGAAVRLEMPRLHAGKLLHVDLWIVHGDAVLALELKYKTRKLSVEIGGEAFNLRDQSGQDIGRYDFVKDIWRLEQLCRGQPKMAGYALLLTNDSAYWKAPRDNRRVDRAFRLHEGQVLHGHRAWDERAGPGTTRGREVPLSLDGTYPVVSFRVILYRRLSPIVYRVFSPIVYQTFSPTVYHLSSPELDHCDGETPANLVSFRSKPNQDRRRTWQAGGKIQWIFENC